MKLNEKTKNTIHLIYGIAVSAMLVTVGILFICSCYSIYRSGTSPFTRESIGAAFSRIAVPTYIAISLVIIGLAIGIVIPKDEPKLKGGRTPRLLCENFARKVDISKCEDGVKAEIEKARQRREIIKKLRLALLIISAIVPLFFLLNPARFSAESGKYNAEILHGTVLYILFLLPSAAFEVFWVIYSDKSYKREYDTLRTLAKSIGIQKPEDKKDGGFLFCVRKYITDNKAPILLGVRIALVGVALVFIAVGVLNGGMADVLNKAIKICTECIGLG